MHWFGVTSVNDKCTCSLVPRGNNSEETLLVRRTWCPGTGHSISFNSEGTPIDGTPFPLFGHPPAPLHRFPPVRRTRSSSMPSPKERPEKRGRSRAASVESKDAKKPGSGKPPDGEKIMGSAAAGAGEGRSSTLAALHRRVGRCILLLARFVDRGREEENRVAAGAYNFVACLLETWKAWSMVDPPD